jgi:uncharacterized protein YjeT (DUF2065 family)|tara:strand:- start:598 stop:798 length:201 start_codon:yes stop_codon:yes gene_type:complete
MLKLILFGIGFVFVFEGIVYFFLAKKTHIMFKILNNTEPDKIRTFSSIIIIIGLCLIYFTLKSYQN